jgi:hypothetical protein
MRRRMTLSLLALVLVSAPALGADPLPTRTSGLHWRGHQLAVSVGVPDLIDPVHVERLTSGFATRVLIQTWLYPVEGRGPVTQSFRHTQIIYDLWGETFNVVIYTAAPGPPEVRTVKTAAEAMALATSLINFPVGDFSRLPAGATARLFVRADLNPLSQNAVTELRRWLARPPAQGRLGPGDSFFGSFVSIFVNPQIEESERRIEFLSQPIQEPTR